MTVVSESVPKYLTHYTKIDALESILCSGLRASNILYLNDTAELFGFGIAKDVLHRFVENRPSIHYQYSEEILHGLSEENLPSIFAASFCKDPDLLSQWRGYGGGTQGISITFQGSRLKEMFDAAGGSPAEIEYLDEPTARHRLEGLLEVVLADFDELLGPPGLTPTELAANAVIGRAPRIKHKGFWEEKEWRFLITRDRQNQRDVRFFPRKGLLVPFLAIPPISSTETNAPAKLPISRITIGPSAHPLLNEKSVKLLLQNLQYDNVQVQLSMVPYRG
jgi:hypothetical protein